MFCLCCYPSLHLSRMKRRWRCHSPKQCYTAYPQRFARLPPAFIQTCQLVNGASPYRPRCSAAVPSVLRSPRLREGVIHQRMRIQVLLFLLLQSDPDLSPVLSVNRFPIPEQGTTRSRLKGMLKTSQRPRENSIGLHSQYVARLPKHPESCAEYLAISGSANREQPSTWFEYKKRGSPLVEREF